MSGKCVWLAIAMGMGLWAPLSASAQYNEVAIYDPWGNDGSGATITTDIIVARDRTWGTRAIFIRNRNGVEDACKSYYLGSYKEGLYADYAIHGRDGKDRLWIGVHDNDYFGSGGEPDTIVCGSLTLDLEDPLYNGHYLDFYGGDGNDESAPFISGDTSQFGGDDDDDLVATFWSGGEVRGQRGDDVIFASGTNYIDILRGNRGNDAISAVTLFFTAPEAMYGGPGEDCRIGSGSFVYGIECACPASPLDWRGHPVCP